MISGFTLLARAGRYLGEIEKAWVRVDGFFGEVDLQDMRSWLEKMSFFDDPADPDWVGDVCPPGRDCSFQIWAEHRIWYSSSRDGLATIESRPITVEELMRNESEFEQKLIEIGNGHVWKFGKMEGGNDVG